MFGKIYLWIVAVWLLSVIVSITCSVLELEVIIKYSTIVAITSFILMLLGLLYVIVTALIKGKLPE
jgi:hypothetical protein